MLFERLWSRDKLDIDFVAAEGSVLVISFSSIGHDPARAPSAEFVGTATDQGRPALFVMDAARRWGQGPEVLRGVEEAIAAITARHQIDQIVALGQSMGGTAALHLAQFLPIDVVLAFGPQSHLGSSEPRWQPWASGVALQPLPAPAGRQRRILMHGLADDSAQAMGFARHPACDHILYSGLTHSALCPHLKQRGILNGLLDSAIAGDRRRLLRIATSAGGRRRKP